MAMNTCSMQIEGVYYNEIKREKKRKKIEVKRRISVEFWMELVQEVDVIECLLDLGDAILLVRFSSVYSDFRPFPAVAARGREDWLF